MQGQGWVMVIPSALPYGIRNHLAQWTGALRTSQQLAKTFQVHPFAISSSSAARPHFNWKSVGTELTKCSRQLPHCLAVDAKASLGQGHHREPKPAQQGRGGWT